VPRFDKPERKGGGAGDDIVPRDAIPGIVEPRCHVCVSDFRKGIDQLIARGTSYMEIQRMFNIDRRSVSNHAKNHLGWEEGAIRRIIEQEAQAAEVDYEEGIKGVLSRRVYLQVALQKALDALLSGDATVEPKDALMVIQMLDKFDKDSEGAAVDELRVQFNAFVQAIREICPPDQWQQILDRTKELLDGDDGPAALPAPS
jgi:hypothetical protein